MMGIWNYRVLREEITYNNQKSESFRVIEVYYKEDGSIEGWADCTTTILHVVSNPLDDQSYAYDDLKGTAHHVLDAFKLPMVQLKDDGETLHEINDLEEMLKDVKPENYHKEDL
jgi:hypothetical protein